ncbi:MULTISPECIES: CarD family transcriptional regulator [unclassified Clostridium]|uniref:CarD family transcriptional regulator n=1 Tax=unclassified Clostridium TaxID=2614128 RepID=UPI00189C4326|nr:MULTISPECIES: CarD family transcriptional regulator [unclassified Clostridium]MBP3915198.1 CarD family transcriptional regulator [Clostridium sp.]MEE0933432.1 CarD family transcriptional regulator [Clostridium sp.]
MFAKNDYIIYGTTGVCKITGIEKKKFNTSAEREYYILKPAYDPNSTIYAPVDNNIINIRKIMTVKEVYDLIMAMPDNKTIWIDDINLRKEKYNEILKKGDKVELVKLIRTLYLEKQKKKNEGKKLYVGDEKIMSEAQRLLHEEFALVLNIKVDEVLPFILGELEPTEKSDINL